MKRTAIKHGAIYSKEQLQKEWIKCREKIPQEKIQGWIERSVMEIICIGKVIKSKNEININKREYPYILGPL